jgi:hypothetical protein
MHVLGNANPSENVPVRNQLTIGGAASEIHRCRQVTLFTGRTIFFLFLPVWHNNDQHKLADNDPCPESKIMVCLRVGHENAENQHIGPHVCHGIRG